MNSQQIRHFVHMTVYGERLSIRAVWFIIQCSYIRSQTSRYASNHNNVLSCIAGNISTLIRLVCHVSTCFGTEFVKHRYFRQLSPSSCLYGLIVIYAAFEFLYLISKYAPALIRAIVHLERTHANYLLGSLRLLYLQLRSVSLWRI